MEAANCRRVAPMMFRIFAAVCPCCRGSGQVRRPVRLCEYCDQPLAAGENDAGRPRLYCSQRCRSAAHRLRQARAALAELEALAERITGEHIDG